MDWRAVSYILRERKVDGVALGKGELVVQAFGGATARGCVTEQHNLRNQSFLSHSRTASVSSRRPDWNQRLIFSRPRYRFCI